ncbi:nucleoid-associated protein [uncultured Sanguibacteroides sp.]|uniref:nucleoid-associated protein n=1 Tax=uncultured Sanguibacteroides sp. TaxID=1635151 RepID=UPI0025E38A80|nr:nucleoid-associated protein [uncultured Sanguibacteroides sp.]
MMNFENCEINNIVIHDIGNKYEEGDVRFSESNFVPDEQEVHNLLKTYFLTPFKRDAFYRFSAYEGELSRNPVYAAIHSVFEDPDSFYKASIDIARHLFDQSNHPNIKSGELYLVHFKNCLLEDGTCDAIGIFKSENKDTFLKIIINQNSYQLTSESGINIKKLDKACLIFNVNEENGYRVTVLDKTNNTEAVYWTTDFLGLEQQEDDYFQTSNYLKLCKDFVQEVYNRENDIPKADQIDMLNRSIDYFKKADTFDEDRFKEEIVMDPQVIRAFEDFKNFYEEKNEIALKDSFDVSDSAVKDEKRYFKHVLKLDKNFHVYIHGQKKYIEKGYDSAKDMNYYKLFFREEN